MPLIAVKGTAFVAGKLFGTTLINSTLRSLATPSDDTLLCAVATRGKHAVVWKSGGSKVYHVVPEDGLVHSVNWLGNSKHLLLGTGDYPLDSRVRWQARIEVWKMDDDKLSCVDRVALPGTCVVAIAVSEDEPCRIVAFSGMRSQDQGFLSVLDARSLLPKFVFDLPFSMVGRVECSEESILVCNRGAVRAISREDGGEKWCHQTAGTFTDFAYDIDSHQLLLSSGEMISAERGRVVENWYDLIGDIHRHADELMALMEALGYEKVGRIAAEVHEELRKLIGYFENNRHRTDYPLYRKKGWDIGSGPTEAGCKISGERLKDSGMRWVEYGAATVAALRALYVSSGRVWDGFWSQPHRAAA